MAAENGGGGGGGGNNDDAMDDNMLGGLPVESYGLLNRIEVLHIRPPPPNIITNRRHRSRFTTAAVPYPPPVFAPPPPTEAGSEKNTENKKTKPEIAEEEKVKKKNTMTKFTDAQKVRMRVFAGGLGWQIWKNAEKAIEKFCEEIGISPQDFKLWIEMNRGRQNITESPWAAN